MEKYIFAPYRRFHVARHVFRQIWHKTWQGWTVLHWSRWNPLSLHPQLSAHGGAYRPKRWYHSQRTAGRSQILSSWRNDKRNGTNAIRRFNPDCSSTVQRFSDSLVLGFLTAMSFWCTELLGMIGSLPIFIPIVITKGQQLQWSRVKITHLEDIPNKVGIVSSKHWPSSLLSVVLFGRLRQGYSIINEGFEAVQNFYLKNNQQLESIVLCLFGHREHQNELITGKWQMTYCVSKSNTSYYVKQARACACLNIYSFHLFRVWQMV